MQQLIGIIYKILGSIIQCNHVCQCCPEAAYKIKYQEFFWAP